MKFINLLKTLCVLTYLNESKNLKILIQMDFFSFFLTQVIKKDKNKVKNNHFHMGIKKIKVFFQ